MNKIKNLFEKHYHSFFFFLFILIYSCIVPGGLRPWQTVDVTQSFHAVDYSMGFCSRFLPGAIYNFLFGAVNEHTLNLYLTVLMVVFFLALSLFLEKFIISVEAEYRFIATVILLFFITGPATFSIYIKVLGMLDVYWLFAALLFFVLLSKKQTWPFLFIPFVLCILTYYVTWLCYIPFFTVIMLYKISVTKVKKDKIYLWGSLAFSLIATAALSVYFAVFEKGNLTYTAEEFIEVLNSRGCDYHWYYTESLYYYGAEMSSGGNIFEEFIYRFSVNFYGFSSISKISVFVLLLPILIFIYKFFLKQFSERRNKLKFFSCMCMLLLFPATFIFAFFTSTDTVRWMGHSFLPLFASFIYVLHNEGAEVWSYVKENFEKVNIKTVLIYLLFYMSVVYDPYNV